MNDLFKQVILESGNLMEPWKLLIGKKIYSSFHKENMLPLNTWRTFMFKLLSLILYVLWTLFVKPFSQKSVEKLLLICCSIRICEWWY